MMKTYGDNDTYSNRNMYLLLCLYAMLRFYLLSMG